MICNVETLDDELEQDPPHSRVKKQKCLGTLVSYPITSCRDFS
ncbi:hypothetical protein M3J09_004656 [Ascochyta lentis]